MKTYFTYLPDGALDGAYIQEPPEEHLDCMIEIEGEIPINWRSYHANKARDGVELIEVEIDLSKVSSDKNAAINSWRTAANLSSFTHLGKKIACDALSRSDIDGIANHISLFGEFPVGFPHVWKAMDNTYIEMNDMDDFKAMYASMAAQGAANFNRSQALKQALSQAITLEDINAITWD